MSGLENRGIKLYAVMAHKPGWSKPRFVWDGPMLKRLHIYERKLAATRRAKHMSDDKQPGGKQFLQQGWHDKSHNTPKLVEVDWIVCEVWCEMTGKVARVS